MSKKNPEGVFDVFFAKIKSLQNCDSDFLGYPLEILQDCILLFLQEYLLKHLQDFLLGCFPEFPQILVEILAGDAPGIHATSYHAISAGIPPGLVPDIPPELILLSGIPSWFSPEFSSEILKEISS